MNTKNMLSAVLIAIVIFLGTIPSPALAQEGNTYLPIITATGNQEQINPDPTDYDEPHLYDVVTVIMTSGESQGLGINVWGMNYSQDIPDSITPSTLGCYAFFDQNHQTGISISLFSQVTGGKPYGPLNYGPLVEILVQSINPGGSSPIWYIDAVKINGEWNENLFTFHDPYDRFQVQMSKSKSLGFDLMITLQTPQVVIMPGDLFSQPDYQSWMDPTIFHAAVCAS